MIQRQYARAIHQAIFQQAAAENQRHYLKLFQCTLSCYSPKKARHGTGQVWIKEMIPLYDTARQFHGNSDQALSHFSFSVEY